MRPLVDAPSFVVDGICVQVLGVSPGQQIVHGAGERGKVGATSGNEIGGCDDLSNGHSRATGQRKSLGVIQRAGVEMGGGSGGKQHKAVEFDRVGTIRRQGKVAPEQIDVLQLTIDDAGTMAFHATYCPGGSTP